MATKPKTPEPWHPTRVIRVIDRCDTSTSPLLVMTDAGKAFVKTLGNPEGPPALISEWIGTNLAAWLGLPTFDIAIVEYPKDLVFPLTKGCETIPGPAFAARFVGGQSWDGTEDGLALVENLNAIAGLVVFDMWTRNYDRYVGSTGSVRCNVRNVFLSEKGARKGHYRLLAIDHTESFRTGRAFTDRGLFGIGSVQDERTYGLFPAFRARVTREVVGAWLDKLAQFCAQDFEEAAREVPAAWGLRRETREALGTFCVERAKFLADNAEKILEAPCGWHPVLPGTKWR